MTDTPEYTVAWQPQTEPNKYHSRGPQVEFLAATEDEVLYSGARGSGKSDALIIDPLRYCHNKNFRGLIIRRTMPELRELINRAKLLYPQIYPKTQWREQEKLFKFISGATIEYGYCDSPDDLERYRGQQYTWIGIDEITQFPDEELVEKLKASLRSVDSEIPIHFRATCNPSGVGVRWVKERWIDVASPGDVHVEQFETPLGKLTTTRKWIQSWTVDNKALIDNNPQYLAKLYSIRNEALRKQWLEASWDAIEGLAFSEFNRDLHVCRPFQIPHSWKKYRTADWGFSDGLAVCLWLAVDYDGNAYVYREFSCNGRKVSPLERYNAEQFGEKLLGLEGNEHILAGVLDSSVWSTRGEVGETPADTMMRLGLRWMPADRSKGSRISGKLLVHEYLKCDTDTGIPKLKIFNNCTQLIKELSSLIIDESNPEDVATKNQDDHAYDALRYGLSFLGGPNKYAVQSMSHRGGHRPHREEYPIIVNKNIGM